MSEREQSAIQWTMPRMPSVPPNPAYVARAAGGHGFAGLPASVTPCASWVRPPVTYQPASIDETAVAAEMARVVAESREPATDHMTAGLLALQGQLTFLTDAVAMMFDRISSIEVDMSKDKPATPAAPASAPAEAPKPNPVADAIRNTPEFGMVKPMGRL